MKNYISLSSFFICFLIFYQAQAQGDVGIIINELNTRIIPAITPPDTAKQFVELLVIGCPGRGEYAGNTPDNIGPDPQLVDLRGWIIDDNNGDFGGTDGVSNGHIRFSNNPVWANVPVGSIILIYNRAAYVTDNPFIDDPDDTVPQDNIYITALGDEVNGRPLFVRDESNNTYPTYIVGDAEADIQGTYTATTDEESSWAHLIFEGNGDAVQTRTVAGDFFHGIVYGSLSGGTLAPNNGATIPSSTQGANKSGTNANNASIYFSHNNADGVFLDNYRHGGNYTITTTINATTSTPGRVNVTAGDRNGVLVTNLGNSLDAGPNQVVCGVESRFQPTGVIGFWSETEMWRFTGNFNLSGNIFNLWEYVSGPGTANDPSNVVIIDVNDPNSTVRAQAGAGIYVFRRVMPDEVFNNPTAGIEYCVDSDTMSILFLGVPDAFAGADFGVCSNTADLVGTDLTSGVPFNAIWEYIPDSGPEGAPAPEFIDDEDFAAETQRVQVTQPGTYSFRLRIGSTDCPDVDVVRVTFAFGDFSPSAGSDQVVCGLGSALGANTDPTSSAYWTISTDSQTNIGVRFDGIVHDPADPLNPINNNPNATITVPQAGTYDFIWNYGFSEGSTNCLQSDTVRITFLNLANASAGPDQAVCGFSTTLNGSPSAGGNIVGTNWTVVSTPNGGTATLSTSTESSTSVSVDVPGRYVFRYSLTGEDPSTGTTCGDGANVEVFFIDNPNPEAENKGVCGLSTTLTAVDNLLDVTGDGDLNDAGEWTVISGPDVGNVTIDDPTQVDSPISVLTEGTYTLRWTVTRTVNGVSCPASIEVNIFFVENFESAGETPNAGADQTEVCGNLATLEGNALTVPDATATWRVRDDIDLTALGVSDVNITTSDNPTASVEVLPIDFNGNLTVTLDFIWSFSKTTTVGDVSVTCSNEDTVRITFFALPEPDAGEGDTVCIGQAGYPYALDANLPTGTVGEWTVVNGPGTATLSDNTNPNSTVAVDAEGLYTFGWALQNGTTCDAVTDQVQIYFLNPATSNAGDDQSNICDFTTNITGNTPTGSDVGEWTLVSGPSTNVAISTPNNPTTNVTITDEVTGSYTFQWSVYRVLNGVRFCEVGDQVTLQFINQPEATAGADQLEICFNNTQNASLDANTPSAPFSGSWSIVSAPVGAVFSFSPNVSTPDATFITDVVGSYTLRWTVAGGVNCSASDDVLIQFIEPVNASINTLPAEICNFTIDLVGADLTGQVTQGQWTATPSAGVIFTNPTEQITQATVPAAGDYTFTWTIGNGVCQDAATSNTVTFFAPLIDPSAEQDVVVYLGQTVDLFANGGPDATYTWTSTDDPTLANLGGAAAADNNPTPTFTASSPSPNVFNYIVTMRTGYSLNDNNTGCTVSIPVRVRIFTELNVPNVFSPNGDGQFDTWQIPLLNGLTEAEVSVFNRWGDKVFSSIGYDIPWNGRLNNTGSLVPHATYYWVIKRPNEPTASGYVVVTY